MKQAIQDFCTQMNSHLKGIGLTPEDYSFDHVCYRADSHASYTRMKINLALAGTLHSETMVRGKPISIFQLKVPIAVGTWQVSLVECIAPSGNKEPSGWEHIELVPLAKKSEALLAHIGSLGGVAKGNGPYQEVVLSFKDTCIKFHETLLLDVVASERAAKPDCVLFDMDGTLVDSVNLKPFKDSAEVLEKISTTHRVVIWTGRDRESALEILKKFDLLKYVSGIQTLDDGPPKPNINGMHHHIAPGRALAMVGDSMTDMSSANALNIPFVHADWGLKANLDQKNYVGSFDSMKVALVALENLAQTGSQS